MSVFSKNGFPTRDCGTWKPPTKTHLIDGRKVVERLPGVPSLKAVDTAGNVVRIPLHNGGSNSAPMDPFRLVTERWALQDGAIPFGSCPADLPASARAHLPDKLKSRPTCRVAADGHPIGVDHPCQCIVELIEHRRQVHAEKEADSAARQETLLQRQAKIAEEQLKSTKEVNTTLLEQMVTQNQALVQLLGGKPAATAAVEQMAERKERGK
jgi:hypothetical protein